MKFSVEFYSGNGFYINIKNQCLNYDCIDIDGNYLVISISLSWKSKYRFKKYLPGGKYIMPEIMSSGYAKDYLTYWSNFSNNVKGNMKKCRIEILHAYLREN